ncbi:protein takeout-like isoform X2 [Drosophila subobscura]|uniref:protein takeout-like isoform X2 n=1 Tax=Drosophila subobscura TaxID=7241 RepID=UPI00155AB82B|nr:protein takeout-like isoform X2 [Drosophila subobscura]
MHYLPCLLWIIVGFFVGLQCQTFPDKVQKCHYGDGKCLAESANALIRNYPKGIPEINLKPFDVVNVKDWVLVNDSQNTTITEIKGFDRDPTKSKIEIHGKIPRLVYKGKYQAKGRMLWMVDINSQGDSNSDFLNFRFDLTLKVRTEYRNNKRYMKIYELVPNIRLDRWIQWMDDFFPDNFDMTIAINNLFNRNWVEFWNELEPGILRLFETVFLGMIEDLFYNIPYDDLFLADAESV